MTRLRHIDIKSKSKIILDAHIGKAQLVTNLQHLVVNGEVVDPYQERQDNYKNIQDLNNDFYLMLKADNFHFHYEANALYHFEKLREYTFKPPILKSTVENNKKALISQIKTDFNSNVITQLSFYVLDKIVDKLTENFKNKYYDDTKYLTWLSKTYNKGFISKTNKLGLAIENYKGNKKLYHHFDSLKALPDNEHWTIDKFCNYYQISINTIKDLLINPNWKDVLKIELKNTLENNKKVIDSLVVKYKL